MRNRVVVLGLMMLFAVSVSAQRQTTSPFSRYGYGDVYSPSTAYNQAMGGTTVGINNPVSINFSNPAAEAFVRPETFLFNVELGGNFRKITDDEGEASTSSVGIESFSCAFPIIPNRWGLAVGLLPYSSVGYMMEWSDSLASNTYEGDGGINQVAFSSGVRLFKGFSLGATFSYVFGTTTYTGETAFVDDAAFYSRKESEYKTKGFLCSTGLMYSLDISEDKSLTVGASYRFPQSLSYDMTNFFGSYIISGYSEIAKDTVLLSTQSAHTDIPQEIVLGFSYSTGHRYQFSLDAGMQDWNSISVYGTVDEDLQETRFLRIGCEIIPDYRSSKYIKRIPLRFGFRYTELPVLFQYNGEQAQAHELCGSLGFQIKSKQTQNSLSLAAEVGARGNKSLAKSLQETFMQVKLQVTLQETWFKKRKID